MKKILINIYEKDEKDIDKYQLKFLQKPIFMICKLFKIGEPAIK